MADRHREGERARCCDRADGNCVGLTVRLAAWRLRFRASPTARARRRQAVVQRRTAGVLRPLHQEGYLVLHDVTLPGWPAGIDSLRQGAPLPPGDVERATARALEVLCPAA